MIKINNRHSSARPIIYIAHNEHEHDRLYTENVVTYLARRGIESKVIEFDPSGPRLALEECLTAKPTAVLGYNSQLDHSWVSSGSFVRAAARSNIPIVQWILDHPSQRWDEFISSTDRNSAFLFNTKYSERYFTRYCMPNAITGIMRGIGPSKYSRVNSLSYRTFSERPIRCIIPITLARLDRTIEKTAADIKSLDCSLAVAVNSAVASARFDLINPLEEHLIAAFVKYDELVDNKSFNQCFRLVEESVQAFRRLKIFEVARDYPVLVQSDPSAASYLEGGAATFLTNVGTRATHERMLFCRAIVCPSPLNDMIHDRAENAVNAGCVAIVEDNLANREVFVHEKNALFFRYEDDSLRECLDIVCDQPERAYAIAQGGMNVRDLSRFRFDQFGNILKVARRLIARRRLSHWWRNVGRPILRSVTTRGRRESEPN